MARTQREAAEASRRRYKQLAAGLAKVGLVLQGSITERTIVREDPAHAAKEKSYGPYYQWTWKCHGKTVTINLSATQAKVYQRAIDEHRKVEKTIEEMRVLSRQILDATTPQVLKRKPRS